MKKRFICILLVSLMAIAPTSAAFSDISDSRVAQTTSVLSALGIMEGTGENTFSPDTALTRAQFCKLAVTALGFSDVSAYGSYTIFPDVKSTHWAAQYINAAVRHPDLKEQAIIRGYADGTFGPDKAVNFGEACTMLLRMLGYTEADVGPFWPADYVARAQALGLTEGITITDAKSTVTRANAAIMLLNTLGTPLKGEEGGLLLNKVASSTIENGILLETSETDASLAANEAIFYEDGTTTETPRKTAGTLDKSLIGVRGTLVIGKDDKAVVGVVPGDGETESYEVTSVSADRIETKERTLRPDRNTKLYISREDWKLSTFAESWAGIQAGDTLTCYYDTYGTLELMAVLPKVSSSNMHSFVYGTSTSANVPEGYTIVKNGVVIDSTKLKKYDVITLDAANHKAIVSDTKLSGRYESGTPTIAYPQSIEMYGTSYAISDTAATSFADLKLGDYITLLFNTDKEVVAAYPKSVVSADMQGIVTAVKESTATVSLINGLTLRDLTVTSEKDLSSLQGRLVTVSQDSSGKAYLTQRTLSGKVSGNWSIEEGKLGDRLVSPQAQIYEEVLSGAPLCTIQTSDIVQTTVPSNQIRYTVTDSAGTVVCIILGDVTGESWTYGIAYGEKRGDEDDENSNVTYHIRLKYWDGSKTDELPYRVLSLSGLTSGTPVGIPKGYSTNENVVNTSLSTQKLTLVDTVELSAFDGTTGVKTKDGYYALADNIGVYVTARNEFISLQSARANYTSFRLYANKSAEDGGKIRVIIAS